ncbi:hypothetical protein BGZ94_004183 [Podila epigama]|nr:hypothetical protein BGZ94_004183 [Podila epigama]
MHRWEWSYPVADEISASNSSDGYKAIFVFLHKSSSSQQVEIVSQFALGIYPTPSSESLPTSSGVRFSLPQIQMPSIPGVRHWRRTSTPERQSTSFWSKFPSFGSSHNSLPSFTEPLNPPASAPTPASASASTLPPTTTSPLSPSRTEIAEPQIPDVSGSSKSSITSSSSTAIPLANDTEDGPLFRATVVECENHIRQMKMTTKRIAKAAQTVLEARRAWVAAEENFAKELANFKPAEQLVEKYLHPMAQTLGERSEMLARQMRNLLIEPLARFQAVDLKAAEVYRKSFDEESKEYYSFLAKYMAMKLENNPQKKVSADARYERKRQHFEAKRFEYWVFLLDMRVGGSKGEELFQHIINYSEKHCRNWVEMGQLADEMKIDLESMVSALAVSQEKTAAQRKERHDQRKRLSHMFDDQELASVNFSVPQPTASLAGSDTTTTTLEPPVAPFYGLSANNSFDGASLSNNSAMDLVDGQLKAPTGQDNTHQPQSPSVTTKATTIGTTPSNIAGIRDLEHQDIDTGTAMGRRKEGFLFATSKPNLHNSTVLDKPSNTNWRKYWCVVSEGRLHEYSHWKKGVTMVHNEPINLRIATVRASRTQERRFCFEVITPKFKRVYQATSTEDMNSWINVISNAIQGLLSGTSSCRNLNLQYERESRPSSDLAGGGGGGLIAGLGTGFARASMEQLVQAASLPTSLQTRVQPGQAVGRKRGETTALGLNEMGQIISPYTGGPATESLYSQDDGLGTLLLSIMRKRDVANNFCADCGAKNPDWCVINIGTLVCIANLSSRLTRTGTWTECSGIHRSLGTHISKVRSFTLDTTSYTRDLFEFIYSMGNNLSNQIWEANLNPVGANVPVIVDAAAATANVPGAATDREPGQKQTDTMPTLRPPKPFISFRKPTVNDSREYKAEFIQKKYVDRAFVDRKFPSEIDKPTKNRAPLRSSVSVVTSASSAATRALFQSIMVNNIPAAVAAFAAGANLNAVQNTSDDNSRRPSSSYFMNNNRKDQQQQQSPMIPPAIDTFDLGLIPNTSQSPILEESMLRSPPADSVSSEASSPKSSVSMASPTSQYTARTVTATEQSMGSKLSGEDEIARAGNIDSMSLPTTTHANHANTSSFMVMQTSPLLIALRHGVPFSQDERYEVFPLAEFIIQNGATNDLSVEVKMLDDDSNVSDVANKENGVDPMALGSSSRGMFAPGEQWDSIGSKEQQDGVNKDGGLTHRRSVGQVLEMSSSAGQRTSAIDYLRAKSVARGESPAMDKTGQYLKSTVPASTSFRRDLDDQAGTAGVFASGTTTASTTTTAYAATGSNHFLSIGTLSPTATSSTTNTTNPPPPSRSAALASMLNLSPRLRPQGYRTINSTSAPVSLTSSPVPSLNNGTSYGAVTMAAANGSQQQQQQQQPRHPTVSAQQDISLLFQKRRGSDTGVVVSNGSRSNSHGNAGNGTGNGNGMSGGVVVSKETKAQYRTSGDFSLLAPISSILSPRFRRQHNASQLLLNAEENVEPSISALLDQSASSFGDGYSPLHQNPPSSDNTGNTGNTGNTTSRARKVKAAWTKSLRFSGVYSNSKRAISTSGAPPTTGNSTGIGHAKNLMSLVTGETSDGDTEGGPHESLMESIGASPTNVQSPTSDNKAPSQSLTSEPSSTSVKSLVGDGDDAARDSQKSAEAQQDHTTTIIMPTTTTMSTTSTTTSTPTTTTTATTITNTATLQRQPSWPDFNTFLSTSASTPDLVQFSMSKDNNDATGVTTSLSSPRPPLPQRRRPVSSSYILDHQYKHADSS